MTTALPREPAVRIIQTSRVAVPLVGSEMVYLDLSKPMVTAEDGDASLNNNQH
jgi:hypothetical protein